MKNLAERSHGSANMETFLSTLTQTTAAVIAILLAAVAAYYIFLQSKAAEYEDKIKAEQSAIRTDIAGLQAQWPMVVTAFLPPEFKERFSANTGNSRGTQLVSKLCTAILFEGPEVTSTLAEVRAYDSFGPEHWKGRAYPIALDEALRVISVGASLAPEGFALGQGRPEDWESKPSYVAAFPWSPIGPGFKEWRDDFDKVSALDHFISPWDDSLIADFKAFQDSHPSPQGPLRMELYVKALRSFHATISSIRGHVRAIDGLELGRSRYSVAARGHWVSLLTLISLVFLVGVVAPLVLMTYGPATTPLTARAILVASLVFLISAFVQFGRDVVPPLKDDPKLYIADRWLRPILEDVDRFTPQTESGATVSDDRAVELLESGYAKELPEQVVASLRSYQAAVATYNKSAADLDGVIVERLKGDSRIRAFVKPYSEIEQRSQVFSMMHASDAVNPKRLEQVIEGAKGSPDVLIGVATATYWGSRGRFAFVVPAGQRDSFIAALRSACESSNSIPQAKDFVASRETLLAATSKLKGGLSAFLKQ